MSASPSRDRGSAPLGGRSGRVRVFPGLLQLPDRRPRDRPLAPQLPLPRDEEGLADLRVRLQRMFRILGLGFHRVPIFLKFRPPGSLRKGKSWKPGFGCRGLGNDFQYSTMAVVSQFPQRGLTPLRTFDRARRYCRLEAFKLHAWVALVSAAHALPKTLNPRSSGSRYSGSGPGCRGPAS